MLPFNLLLLEYSAYYNSKPCSKSSINFEKQVAKRATIAHMTASHQYILNNNNILNWSRAVHGLIWLNLKLIRDYEVVLLTCKNEEDTIKNEGARVHTRLQMLKGS